MADCALVAEGAMSQTASVSALFYYPVKSTRGIATERATLSPTGLTWDRQWMVVDAAQRFLTQRTHPHMARIIPEVLDGTLHLSHPELPDLAVPDHADGETLTVRIWDDLCPGTTQAKAADEWLTKAIGEPVRLVRACTGGRAASARYAGATPAPIGFPDGYPLLICNAASLADLNTRLPQAVPMERFRPNVVLAGLPAWEEDRIESLTAGAVRMRLVKPCTRCAIPTFDHSSGEPSVNVLPTLKKFRFDRALKGVTFGVNAVIEGGVGEELARGAALEVGYRN
jgi:uncharacterized protein YcbX